MYRISLIAAAVPVLVREMEKMVMNERAITIVLIAPIRKRNCFGSFSCPVISEPKTAAWPEPMPGRNEDRGAVSAAARVDFIICFFGRERDFKEEIFCGGIRVLFFRETIRAEIPKRPVKSGRRGSLAGRLNARKPRNPAKMKIISEGRISFSRKIRKREAKIRMKGIMGLVKEKI